jgi:phage/plasmid-like protein (TIGR03299 family)|tara:strand:- start:79 stop:1101 length:1023 start_codon:yes stop_codon:yes gene_type:complete
MSDTQVKTQLVQLDARIGVDVSDSPSLDGLITQAGFDFEVEKVPVFNPEGNEVPNHFCVRRSDTKQNFAVMRKRYTPIPMRAMLEPFYRMVEEFGGEIENAGLIQGGKKCWIAANMNRDFGLKNREDDKMESRIMALMCNDGTKRDAYFAVNRRIFCNNQMSMIQKAASQSEFSVSHTKNWRDNLDRVRDNFHAALRGYEYFEKSANKLDDSQINPHEVRGFTHMLLPDPERKVPEGMKLEDIRTTNRLDNRREKIVELFTEGAGNRGLTRWDAFNALTEWVNHHNNSNKLEKQGHAAAERRFVNTLFGGTGHQLMHRGMDLLLETKKFKGIKPTLLATN